MSDWSVDSGIKIRFKASSEDDEELSLYQNPITVTEFEFEFEIWIRSAGNAATSNKSVPRSARRVFILYVGWTSTMTVAWLLDGRVQTM